jgi:hypothetical protein
MGSRSELFRAIAAALLRRATRSSDPEVAASYMLLTAAYQRLAEWVERVHPEPDAGAEIDPEKREDS